jgi:hypothetical protein
LEQLDFFGRLDFATHRFRLVQGSVLVLAGVVPGHLLGTSELGTVKFARTFEIVAAFGLTGAVGAQCLTILLAGGARGTVFDGRDADLLTRRLRGTTIGGVHIVAKVGSHQHADAEEESHNGTRDEEKAHRQKSGELLSEEDED